MSYSTLAEVRLLTYQTSGKDFSDTEIQVFIDQADSEINTTLVHIYDVPFSSTPPLIANISQQLAASYCLRALYAGHSKNQAPNAGTYYSNAQKMLLDVYKGDKLLVDSSGDLIPRNDPITYPDTDDFTEAMPEFDEDYPDIGSITP